MNLIKKGKKFPYTHSQHACKPLLFNFILRYIGRRIDEEEYAVLIFLLALMATCSANNFISNSIVTTATASTIFHI